MFVIEDSMVYHDLIPPQFQATHLSPIFLYVKNETHFFYKETEHYLKGLFNFSTVKI